jgi:hypothetical protein
MTLYAVSMDNCILMRITNEVLPESYLVRPSCWQSLVKPPEDAVATDSHRLSYGMLRAVRSISKKKFYPRLRVCAESKTM